MEDWGGVEPEAKEGKHGGGGTETLEEEPFLCRFTRTLRKRSYKGGKRRRVGEAGGTEAGGENLKPLGVGKRRTEFVTHTKGGWRK